MGPAVLKEMLWSPGAPIFLLWSPGVLQVLSRSPGALSPFGHPANPTLFREGNLICLVPSRSLITTEENFK